MASENVPTNKALYARVKAEAKRKFDVYPSAYANAWLVREYKRGGTYRKASQWRNEKNHENPQNQKVKAVVALADGLTRNGRYKDREALWPLKGENGTIRRADRQNSVV